MPQTTDPGPPRYKTLTLGTEVPIDRLRGLVNWALDHAPMTDRSLQVHDDVRAAFRRLLIGGHIPRSVVTIVGHYGSGIQEGLIPTPAHVVTIIIIMIAT